MIEPKTITTRRFIIFMAIAFGVALIPMCLAGIMLSKGNTILFMFLFRIVAVMIPLIAVIVSGAGFKKLGFKPKKFKIIPLALMGPQILCWIGMAIYFAIFPDMFRISYDGIVSQLPEELSKTFDPSVLRPEFLFVEMMVLSLTAVPISQLLPSLGEEAGWRGVMYPFLKERLGVTPGRIVGGILWGIWHAPLTVEGHNFGKDYPGYPYVGILLMILSCTAIGAFLMWLTRRTDSVYPAAIAHAVNNSGGGMLGMILLLNGIGDIETYRLGFAESIVLNIPLFITGIIALFLMLRKNKVPSADSE